jgi:hypothetical protein
MADNEALREMVQRLENDLRNLSVRPTMGLPSTFSARPGEDPSIFIKDCLAWCDMNGQRDAANVVNTLQLVLKGPARLWLDSITDEVKQDRQRLVTAFRERFVDNMPNVLWLQEQQLLSRQMQHNEKLEDYIFDIDNLCSILKKPDNDRVSYFVRGLIPSLKPFVIQQKPTTWKEAIQAARLSAISIAAAETSRPGVNASTPSASTLSSLCAPSYNASSYDAQASYHVTQYPSFNVASSSLYTLPTNVLNASQALSNQQYTSNEPTYAQHAKVSIRPSSTENTIHTLVNTVGELTQTVKQLQQIQQSQPHIAGISSSQQAGLYNNSNNKTVDIVCQLCGGYHSARKCYQYNNARKNNQNFYNTNYRNNNYQHNERNNQQGNRDTHITCYNCSTKGHRAANCRKPNSTNTHLNN